MSAEKARSEVGYGFAALLGGIGAVSDHGGACPYMYDPIAADSRAQPAHEHRHIRSLPAAIGVELIEHQKEGHFRRGLGLQKGTILGPNHHQLNHHVVREEDVGWMGADFLSLGLIGLTGVAGEGDGKSAAEFLLVGLGQILERRKLGVPSALVG